MKFTTPEAFEVQGVAADANGCGARDGTHRFRRRCYSNVQGNGDVGTLQKYHNRPAEAPPAGVCQSFTSWPPRTHNDI
ncbi:hypothetical protein RUM43_007377 [Polyplax serrata]|uniref:Uncharacterized protein n=1 Tax=Polyplax serrata TaxID=468196 RepID=A0AAN8S7T8_POLSC